MVQRVKRKGYLDYRIGAYGAAMVLVAGGGIALAPFTKGLSIFACMPFFHSLWKRQRPYVLGKKGETAVRRHLQTILPPTVTLLNDIVVTRGDGSQTQIDHIVVGPGGVMVIETKNWTGTIHVRPYERYWIRESKPGSRFEVYSPTRQNYGHIMAIKELLSRTGRETFVGGMVVFVGNRVALRIEQLGDQRVRHLREVVKDDFEQLFQLDSEDASEQVKSTVNALSVHRKRRRWRGEQT